MEVVYFKGPSWEHSMWLDVAVFGEHENGEEAVHRDSVFLGLSWGRPVTRFVDHALHMYVFIYAYTCMHIYLYMCVCGYIYIYSVETITVNLQ